MRFTAMLAALMLLAVFPAALHAQSPTPTATVSQDEPAADPPADAPSDVTAVYDDYVDDGVIDVCSHTRDTLQATLDSIEPAYDRDFPDFREAVQAGIQRHDDGRCDDDSESDATPTPTASPSATASPTDTPESGELPDPPQDDDDGGGALPPPDDGSLPPEESAPTATPSPVAPVPTPGTQATPPPVATPTPTPAIVTSSRASRLLVPALLVAAALLGAAALVAASYAGSPRVRHAFSEAALRSRSTWADFSDWLRLGR